MNLNRREMLRWGAVGAAGAMLSSATSAVGLPSVIYAPRPTPIDPLAPAAPAATAPAGIDPNLFARAKASLDAHRYQVPYRDVIGIVDFSRPSRDPRFHVVDLMNGRVETYRVAHGSGSDPAHTGFLERFSNRPGSEATSNGAYTTGDYYHGKYGLSMKLRGHDWSNSNAESRAIVIHNAWYAEPEMVGIHGKLGRSQGCFAFSREDQWKVMRRLAGGRMIYADKLA
jgi:L,D-transpeptidase-like protein